MYKILQISIEVNSGSVGRIAENIGIKVLEEGWESYITFARNHLPSKSKTIKIGNKFDIYWHGLNTRLFDSHCLHSKSATRKLIDEIIRIKPDIIHLHHIHGYYINMNLLFNYIRQTNTPIVWTFHDCWSYTGHCTHYSAVKCYKWETECNCCIQKQVYPATLFWDRSRKNFQTKKELFLSIDNLTIVCVSKWLQNEVKRSFFKDVDNRLIYNGVNTNIFKPLDNINDIKLHYGLNNKYIILGVSSPWTIKKGYADFLKISQYLKEDEIIVMVGLSKSQLRELPANILGFERTENLQQLVELYNIADVYLNLSVEETFGMTNIESYACGTPIIVYNKTACPEVVDNSTGIIAEYGEIKNITDAIASIKEKTKEHFSKSCRDKAIMNFNFDNMFNDYIELYKSLLS